MGSTCAVEETGDLWCWGTGGNGRLGRGSAAIATRPVRVVTDTGLVKALDVSVGNNHACAVAVDGNVWCWGNFATRRLGSNQTVDQWSPILVPLVNGVGPVNATRVTSSDVLTCAYDDVGGRAWCWGTNNGRLGNGTTAAGGALPAPVITSGMVGRLMGINSGPSAASGCGWTDERALYCWGSGTSGQLGVTPSLITTGTPVRVQFPGIAP